MLFSYNYRPYEISIIIGIVAPMLHGDALFLQVSTVRNFDYHRNCFSHAEWGCFFSTSADRTKFRLSSELLLPCCMGILFFTSADRTKFRLSSELLLPSNFQIITYIFFHRSRAKVMIFKIQVGERQEFQCTQPEYGCIGQFSNNHIHFYS